LAVHPDSGAPRLGERVRICVVSPYVVIYEHIEADDMVMIFVSFTDDARSRGNFWAARRWFVPNG
jgi:plasmid stabilization system protein ParE